MADRNLIGALKGVQKATPAMVCIVQEKMPSSPSKDSEGSASGLNHQESKAQIKKARVAQAKGGNLLWLWQAGAH